MVGALQMEDRCAGLEDALTRTDHAGAAAVGKDVKQHQLELEKVPGGPASCLLPIQAPGEGSCSTTDKRGTMEPDHTH